MAIQSARATATTSYGALQGTEENGVYVFRGVPFARPPVGALRFAPPRSPEPWDGVRDATRFAPASLQAYRPAAGVLGIAPPETSEDCLYLNIWTPAPGDGRRPVFVWIHGGGFAIGTGSEATYDGARLAKRGDAVVVTINYRLGSFGFLRGRDLGGDTLDSTGNEGILDQIAALEWVRDEIAAFGGDPGNVTVAGESAGAISVACLLASPRVRGLFHKAVIESGSLNLATTPEVATDVAKEILDELAVAPAEAGRLRDLPAEAILAAQDSVSRRSRLPTTFAPVADGELIPARPFEAIATGSARGVPLLIGTNQDEMKLYHYMAGTTEPLDEAGLLERCLGLLSGGAGASDARRLIETYRSARAARGQSTTPTELWLAIWTDYIFRFSAMRLAELQSAQTPDTYAYMFAWSAAASDGPQGAFHALELPFVFGTLETSAIGRLAGRTVEAEALSARMQDAWLAFARTGSPRTPSLPDWEPYAPPRRATMLLGAQPTLIDAPQEAERAAWESLSDS